MNVQIAKISSVVALASAVAACNPGGATANLTVQGTEPMSLNSTTTSAMTSMSSNTVTLNQVDIPVINTAGVEIGVLTLTDARIGLKEIEFDLPEQEGDDDLNDDGIDDDGVEDSIEYEGPFVVDLIADTITPSLGTISMAADTYTEVELKIDRVENDTQDDNGSPAIALDDPMYGYSIYLEGTYSNDGGTTNTPFLFVFDLDEEVRITADSLHGFEISEGRNDVIIAFRLARWFNFTGLVYDLSDAVLDGNSEIVLDENASGNNSQLREEIRDLIKDSADFGRDDDHSGELESDEDDDDDSEDLDDD